MKKVVTEIEILDFAEGAPLDQTVEETLISILSGSPEFRLDLENYRRDLAFVDQGIPEIPLTLEIARELPALAKRVLERRYKRFFAPTKFFRSREILVISIFFLVMFFLVREYLWLWIRKN